jgi:RimJ/RimL family protein N-acetyltransferase
MLPPKNLQTERLRLRRWQQADLEPFAAINADPDVMEFFTATLSHKQSVLLLEEIESAFEIQHFGLWAVEVVASGEFIGFVGLNRPRWVSDFTPCFEIGWRLAKSAWGQGYAPEGARAVLQDGFQRFELNEILSWTAATNAKSVRVMEKIGMVTDAAENFLHPLVPDWHPLKPHVLYRMTRQRWQQIS